MAVLLRNGVDLAIEQALAAESAVYPVLQSGPEFEAWRSATNVVAAPPADHPAVVIERTGGSLHIELNRPRRHNAFSRSMRDGLFEALALAMIDDSIEQVTLSGRGPSFCSGGDLGEFGSRPDAATAHRTRLTRSPARLMAQLTRRLGTDSTVRLHGACLGAGIELAAFAGHVTASREREDRSAGGLPWPHPRPWRNGQPAPPHRSPADRLRRPQRPADHRSQGLGVGSRRRNRRCPVRVSP